MNGSNGCPRDRSELLAVLEGGAPESLRRHVQDCGACRREVAELQTSLELLQPAPPRTPSDRVRREAISYARSRLQGTASRWARWRAPAAAAAAAIAAVLSGTIAYWRTTGFAVEARTPPWTLVLAVLWALGLFLYASPRERLVGREQLRAALIGVTAFVLLTFLCPIPVAVSLCAELLGAGPLGPTETFWAFAITASLYACLASGIASCSRAGDRSRSDRRMVALLFTVLAAPMLLMPVATSPLLAIVGGTLGLWCGASVGCRVR